MLATVMKTSEAIQVGVVNYFFAAFNEELCRSSSFEVGLLELHFTRS
jgi:hypothetical protein